MKINGISFKNTTIWKDISLWGNYLEDKNYKKINNTPYEVLNLSNYDYSDLKLSQFEKSVTILTEWFKSVGILYGRKQDFIDLVVIFSAVLGKHKNFDSKMFFDNLNQMKSAKVKLESLISKLELKHEIPLHLLNYIEELQSVDIKILFQILDKKSLRKLDFMTLSKKEAHFFKTCNINLSRFGTDNNYSLLNYIYFCKLIKEHKREFEFYKKFYFDSDLYEQIDDTNLKYWQTVYQKISCWDYDPHYRELTEIIDYLLHFKTYFPHINLIKNQTKKSLLRRAEKWVEETFGHINIDYENKVWGGDAVKNSQVEINGIVYEFTQILTGKRLYFEGFILKHCVLSYLKKCEKGTSSIWSMHAQNEKETENLTIEIISKQIVQVAGVYNRAPNTNENQIINNWFKNIYLPTIKAITK